MSRLLSILSWTGVSLAVLLLNIIGSLTFYNHFRWPIFIEGAQRGASAEARYQECFGRRATAQQIQSMAHYVDDFEEDPCLVIKFIADKYQ